MTLTAEQLLAGSALTHEVEVPSGLLADADLSDTRMVLRPLTVVDVQRVSRAAREDRELSATLMIHLALVEPALSVEQARRLPAGLARFLVDQINDVSGMDEPRDRLAELVQSPLARACFVLADEFGWTAQDVSAMTIGQILLYLEMAGDRGDVA